MTLRFVSEWGAATASSCQSGINTLLSYLQKRASSAIATAFARFERRFLIDSRFVSVEFAQELSNEITQLGALWVMASKKRSSGAAATPATDAKKPRTRPATTPAAAPPGDESDDFAFEVPPMSQARKSFGAEMAKLQMAGASGGVDDEHKFLRGIATLGKDLSCCLCLSTFERPVRTSCKHYYCAECLNESLRRKQQCPLCKEKVTRRDVEDDEFVAALVWKYRRIVTAANA